jgi:hypothetical protein
LKRLFPILILLSLSSFAAVSLDTKFEKGGNSASPFSYVSNAGTVAGSVGANSNRCLIGYAGFRTITPTSIAMTWAGTSMTQIGTTLSDGTDSIALFGLIAPATGAQTLSVSWTGGTSNPVVLGAVSLFNCDQTTGWQNNTSATGTGTSASITITTTSGDMAIAGHVNNNATGTSIATGTSDWTETAFNGNYAQAHNAASGASTAVAWTLGSSVAWANIGVDVMQFSSGGSTCTPTIALMGAGPC